MPLPTQLVTIPLAQGINQSVDEKIAPAGVLTSLENGEVLRTGEVTKRAGYTEITQETETQENSPPTEGTITEAKQIIDASGNIILAGRHEYHSGSFEQRVTGDMFFSYFDQNDIWKPVGHFAAPAVGFKTAITTNENDDSSNIMPTVAYADGRYMYAHINRRASGGNDRLIRTEIDADTDQVIQTSTMTITGVAKNISVIAVGSNFYASYISDTSSVARVYLNHNTSNASADHVWTIHSDKLFDICEIDDSDFAVAFKNTSGDLEVHAVLSALSNTFTASIANAIGCSFSAGRAGAAELDSVCVMYQQASDDDLYFIVIRYEDLDVSTTTPVKAKTLGASDTVQRIASPNGHLNSTNPAEDNRCAFFVEILGSPSNLTHTYFVTITTQSFPFSASSYIIPFSSICSRGFVYNGRPYCVLCPVSDTQAAYYLAMGAIGDVPTEYGAMSLKVLEGKADTREGVVNRSDVAVVGDKFVQALVSKTSASNLRNDIVGLEFDFSKITPNFWVNDGSGEVILSTQCLAHLDAGVISEMGFFHFPYYFVHNTTSGTTGNIAAGTYKYVLVYEYLNGNGDIERSAPSEEVTVVVASATDDISFDYMPYAFKSIYRGSIRAQLYRTLDGGAIFYRLPNYRTTISSGIGTIQTIHDDDNSDADIASNATLYTTGGVVSNITPGAPYIVKADRGYAYIVPYDERSSIWISKKKRDGVAYEFSDLIKHNPRVGDISALEFMDGKMFMFTSSSIYYASVGEVSDIGVISIGNPIKIPFKTGSKYLSATVGTKDGIYFQTDNGIHLLTRDHSVIFVGDSVRDYRGRLLMATNDPAESRVLFFPEGSSEVLAYNDEKRVWGTYSGHSMAAGGIIGGDLVWADSNGLVRRRNTSYQDGSSDIVLKVKTSWLNLSGINGFQRIRWFSILGDFKSDHTLSVKVYYDHSDTASQTISIDTTSALSMSDQIYRFRGRLNRQKCSAIRFEITDADGADTKENYSINAIVLGVAAKSGISRLRTGKTV